MTFYSLFFNYNYDIYPQLVYEKNRGTRGKKNSLKLNQACSKVPLKNMFDFMWLNLNDE